MVNARALTVAELFAGVGGFRLGLEGLNHPDWPEWVGRDGAGMRVVWSNQWEPATKVQHASDCYAQRFGPNNHVCKDIAEVARDLRADPDLLPAFDILVGGFPCQDYSVAKTLSAAAGINGRKGVLWWEIRSIVEERRPRFLILENVDRLLKSPATHRGRDFAVILWCLDALGYAVEWRVINAADYGFPQRRRRVFVVAHRLDEFDVGDRESWLRRDGVLASAFAADYQLPVDIKRLDEFVGALGDSYRDIQHELAQLTEQFPSGHQRSPFGPAGVMCKGEVLTTTAMALSKEPKQVLRDVLVPVSEVPAEYWIPDSVLPKWRELKGSKSVPRVGRDGFTYNYSEGAVAFPEPLDQPSRTILTGEGGSSPSRFKHVVKQGRRHRRLLPVELEFLNGFPPGWTDTGMPDTKRAFMMGNALVVGIVQRIGREISSRD